MRGSNEYKTSSQQRFHSNGDSKQNSLGCQRNNVPPKSITIFITSIRIIAFHNIQIKKRCELKVYSNQHSPLCLVLIYLEVKLDKSLKFCHHRLALRKNFACPTAEVTCSLRGVLVPKHQIQLSYF